MQQNSRVTAGEWEPGVLQLHLFHVSYLVALAVWVLVDSSPQCRQKPGTCKLLSLVKGVRLSALCPLGSSPFGALFIDLDASADEGLTRMEVLALD